MRELIEKAGILVEALPYIRNFYGKTFVIKYGGAAQIENELKNSFARDIVLLNFIGINPVIVHGGGPKINEIIKKMGKEPSFIQGQRVTDKETMDIVEMVLSGLINKEIVALINNHGGKAVGLSGKDGSLIKAKKAIVSDQMIVSDQEVIKRSAVTENQKKDEEVMDIGLVGEVESIDPEILNSLQKDGFIPVVSPIGTGSKGEAFNINADHASSAIAIALSAEKLILLTDVLGVKDKDSNIISTVRKKDIKTLIRNGIISGGMIPKVQACVNSLNGGVKKTHIVDGRIPHCLLLEIFTRGGVGTEVVG